MKKIILLLIFFCFTFGFSQEKEDTRYFPVVYILKNSNDSISAKVRNTGTVSNKKYSVYTILMKMKMVDKEKNTTWVKPGDVKYIKITDNENVSYEYYDSAEKNLNDVGLVRAFYEGKNISGYQAYSNSGFSIISKEYIVDKDKKVIFEGHFADQKFRSFVNDPNLEEKLKSAKTWEDYSEVLQLWDSKFD
ncbi:hypothetical protein ACVVIH_08115 [Chryseobacterium arthrosphaerae]|uniref:hypothetical protein n=1 Tax=Chryseobacterium arthrosphaerae TaxID=651561 RepID=UPI003D33FAC5